MHKKYSVGFFITSLVLFLLIGVMYKISDNRFAQKQEETKLEPSIQTEGQALKEECFFLIEKNGYVVVYEHDKKTIYEYTNILVSELPVILQNEIKNGKYIENMEELYGFLENYSS